MSNSMMPVAAGAFFALGHFHLAHAAASSSTHTGDSPVLLLLIGLALLVGWSRANRRARRVLVHDRRKSRDW